MTHQEEDDYLGHDEEALSSNEEMFMMTVTQIERYISYHYAINDGT